MPSMIRILTLRVRLLVRQKLALFALVGGVLSVVLSSLFASASFLKPAAIFWDFSLGASFVLQSVLTLYLTTQLVAEERNRRTLHLLLASGVSRPSWLLGNTLGIWLVMTAMGFVWTFFMALVSSLSYDAIPWTIAFQVQGALSVELLLISFMGVWFSLWLRPLLALASASSLFVFLHSVTSVEQIFADKESGHLINSAGISTILKLARLLPPLEWFDLRVFVGHQDAVSWMLMGNLFLVGSLWSLWLALAGVLTFERIDL